jgi:hypothetical protein
MTEPLDKMLDDVCVTCGQAPDTPDYCPQSVWPCRHHCNHYWLNKECCWCGHTYREDLI